MKKIVLNGLTIHDITDPDLGFLVGDQPIEGLDHPLVEVNSFPRSRKHGQFISSNYYRKRVVRMPVVITGSDTSDHYSKRFALQKAMTITTDSKNRPQTKVLYVKADNNKEYRVMFIAGELILPFKNQDFARGFIRLECFDPFVESFNETTEIISLPVGGGMTLETDLPVDFTAQVGGSGTIINNGNVEFFPVITLRGVMQNPVISNYSYGKNFELSGLATLSTDRIEIDMKNGTIKKNGSTNYLMKKTDGSEWWSVRAGTNIIRFNDDIYDADTTATIAFRSAYTGI